MPAPAITEPAVARLLVADDQPHIRAALEMLLDENGYQIELASCPAEVLASVERETFDTVLLDLNYSRDTTGGAEGLELVSRIRAMDRSLPLVMMTAWGNVELAVEAMRRGASDFIQKPWNSGELLEKLREQVAHGRLRRSLQRRKEEESAEAAEVQRSLLPSVLPRISGYDISALSRPKYSIGGDYYNVERISEGRFALCIGDVAGKGLPGALLMSNLQAAVKPLMGDDLEPWEVCSRLNRGLCAVMPSNKFISFFYGVLDAATGRLTYCNAGHNPPLLLRSDGSARQLDSSGGILGQFPVWNYGQSEVSLNPGDTLLLFTDGLVEACDEQGELFGEEKLLQYARRLCDAEAEVMRDALCAAASAYATGNFQDDVTLIVLRRSPGPGALPTVP